VLPDQAARWVTDVFGRGSRVVWARRLRLGGWHVSHALDVIDADGRTHPLVLRRWARPGWEVDDPDYTVERETRVLELLRSTQVPAPAMVAADPESARCDVPAMLLTRLAGHPRGVTLDQLAQEVGAPKPSVHRALATLARAGLAEQERRGGRYRIGLEFVRLAFAFYEGWDEQAAVQPSLDALAARFGETAHYARLEGPEVVYIAKVTPAIEGVRMTSRTSTGSSALPLRRRQTSCATAFSA